MKKNYALFLALSGSLISTSAFAAQFSDASALSSNAPSQTAIATTQTPNNLPAHIVGHVRNTETQEFLPNVLVEVLNTKISVTTDVTGHFMLKNLPVGKLRVRVAVPGFEPQIHEITTTSDATLVSDFEIVPNDVNLGDVVVSATRNATKRRLAPTLVNVLDAKIFDRTQSSFLSQALKYQPGVRVEDNCQNCGFSQVRINGLDGPYSQILVDSRPVYSALAGVYGLEQIPTNMIERIEVMRGGGSALFGSSAIAGVINVITKDPTSSSASFSHEIRGIGGLNTFENTTNLNATYVTENNKLGITIFGQLHHRSPYDYTGDGYSELPMLDGSNVGMRAFFRVSDYSKLTAELHNTREFRRGGDNFDEEPHNAHVAEQLRHNNITGSLNYNFISPDAKHRFNAYASFMKVQRESYYGGGEKTVNQYMTQIKEDLASFTQDDAKEMRKRMISYGRTNGMTNVFGAQYSYDFDQCLFMPSQFTVGLERSSDNLEDKSGYRKAFINQKVNTNSLYLQNEWKNDMWSFLLGGRLDKHSLVKKAIFSPRANLRFNPTKDLVLRANFSSGFRAPQVFDEDLHVANAGGDLILIENDPNLHEERSNSFSLSSDWYTHFGAWQLNLTAEGFYTELHDAFSLTQKSETEKGSYKEIVNVRSNSQGAKVMGVSLEGRLTLPKTWSLQMGVTYHKNQWNKAQKWDLGDAYETRRMYRTPDLYGYFISTFNVTKQLDLTFTGNFTGSMLVGHNIPTEDDGKTLSKDVYLDKLSSNIKYDRVLSGEGQTNKPGEVVGPRTFKTPSFFELGVKAQYSFPIYKYYKGQVFAGVQNIFNSYQDDFDLGYNRDSAYIYGPMAPRSFYAGFRVNF